MTMRGLGGRRARLRIVLVCCVALVSMFAVVRTGLFETFNAARTDPSLLNKSSLSSQTLGPARVLVVEDGVVIVKDNDGRRSAVAGSSLAGSGKVRELLDWRRLPSGSTTRMLLTVDGTPSGGPGSSASRGRDLWEVDSDGLERFLAGDVLTAKLSPAADRIVYSTTEHSVVVRRSDGELLRQVSRGYDPSWSSDGKRIVLSRAKEGADPEAPGSLHISTFDLDTGRENVLTTGYLVDDARPEFHPFGRWILFVSGARSGLGSFWRVPASGGTPTQLTNLNETTVTDSLVPTPYKTTLWSSDGRWFLYDFKQSETKQVWGLKFSAEGNLEAALILASGLNPQWVIDGRSVAVQAVLDGGTQIVIVQLPQ